MAPFGKLYGYKGNPRTTGLLVIAKENNLDVELVHTLPREGLSAEYLKLNQLAQVPTFEGADGFVLSEVMAIAVYFTSQNEKTPLLGKTKQDYASILKWMSFANTELLPGLGGWLRPLLGFDPYNKKNVETSQERANKAIKLMEDHLTLNTYLVSERLTLADIFCSSIIARGFEAVLDKAWREDFPAVVRWYDTVANQPMYKAIQSEPTFIEEAVKYTPPKKEEKPKAKQEKKEEPKPKSKATEGNDEEDEPQTQSEPKPKHPLEALGKPTIALDDWKRSYKNEETREVALPWFWKNVNFEEYSIWQVDYKYNKELTLVFMSANLITGFFARLEASRKYIQGCAIVFGKSNDSVIRGAFVIRGQDWKPAFEVAPDWESFEFKKLDPKSEKDREVFDDILACDKSLTIDGKEYEYKDGQVFV